ncbi:MAG: hypothetical protein MK319_10360 [Pseudomonadales bacterium]|nr:hypothetical protein [Pseudomonadales bacterium]
MKTVKFIATTFTALSISACAVSAATQALMDEYERTIPSCASDQDCGPKWAAARTWVVQNSDFSIRSEGDSRIMATSNIISQSGMGVTVDRVAADAGGYQITVTVECFSAYGCPNLWQAMVEFNQAVNTAQR